MKKLMMIIAVATFALTSCNKEEVEPVQQTETETETDNYIDTIIAELNYGSLADDENLQSFRKTSKFVKVVEPDGTEKYYSFWGGTCGNMGVSLWREYVKKGSVITTSGIIDTHSVNDSPSCSDYPGGWTYTVWIKIGGASTNVGYLNTKLYEGYVPNGYPKGIEWSCTYTVPL